MDGQGYGTEGDKASECDTTRGQLIRRPDEARAADALVLEGTEQQQDSDFGEYGMETGHRCGPDPEGCGPDPEGTDEQQLIDDGLSFLRRE